MQCVFIRKKSAIIWMVVHPKRRRKGYVTGYLHTVTGVDDRKLNRPTRNRKISSFISTAKYPSVFITHSVVRIGGHHGIVYRHQLGNLRHHAAPSSRHDHGTRR